MANHRTPEQRLSRAKELGIIVDEEDRWLLSRYTWHIDGAGELTANEISGKPGQMVRLKTLILKNDGVTLLRHTIVAHRNGNKLDNRRENLRIVNRKTK